MSFHFPPVSFSLEALPCRSPCPLATDVLSWKKSGVVLWIAFSVVPYPPIPLHSHSHPRRTPFFFSFCIDFFLNIFFLELGCQEKEGKKEWKINREAQSDPVVSVRFPFQAFEEKHLSGGGMRPNCSQSLLILPVQSPRGAEGEGQGGVAGSYRHLAMTSRLHSCPLKLGLFSLNCSEARRRATVWLTTNPRGIFIRHSSHCRTTNGFNSPN